MRANDESMYWTPDEGESSFPSTPREQPVASPEEVTGTSEGRRGMATKEDIHTEYAAAVTTRVNRVVREIRIFARHTACLELALDKDLIAQIHRSWTTELPESHTDAYRSYVSEVCGPIAVLVDRIGNDVLEMVRALRPDLTSDDIKSTYRDRARTQTHDFVVEVLGRQHDLAGDIVALEVAVCVPDSIDALVDAVAGMPLVREKRPLPEYTDEELALVKALMADAQRFEDYLRHRLHSFPGRVGEQDADDLVQQTYADYLGTLRRGKIRDPRFDVSVGGERWAQAAYVVTILRNRYNDYVKALLGPNGKPRLRQWPTVRDEDGEEHPLDVADTSRDATEARDSTIDIRRMFLRAAAWARTQAQEECAAPRVVYLTVCERFLTRRAGGVEVAMAGDVEEADDSSALREALLSVVQEVAPHLVGDGATPEERADVAKAVLEVLRECLTASRAREAGP